MCEFPDERAFHPRLTGHIASFDDHDAAADRAIVEGRPDGREVVAESGVIGLEAVWPVESELLGGEVAFGLRLVLSRQLEFAGAYESRHEFVPRHVNRHVSVLPLGGA